MKIVTAVLFASLAACADTEGSSAYSLTQEPGACGSLETHVFGIHSGADGRVSVHIARPGTHAVVLSAVEATTWTVTAGPGVTIEGIYAIGKAEQIINGPRGIKAVAESQEQGDPFQCGYGWPVSGGSECNTEELINLVEKRVHAVTSYHGCGFTSSFQLNADLSVSATCDEQSYVQNCDGEDSCGGPLFL